ncbi:MAG: DUF7133 domain-containing protein [Akkermansiaceae bacterium]
MRKLATILTLSLLGSSMAIAKKTQSARTGVNTPEQELAGFTVPEGFVVELVASEKDGIVNPIDLTFDDAGRLWTQTARMYPLDPVKDIKWGELMRLMDNPAEQDKNPEFKRIKDLYQGVTQGTDDILILSDLENDKPVKVKKFATGLALPQSILPYKNGTYVAHGSELIFLDDIDKDGTADKRVPVLTGFGFTDTHTMAHSLVRAPGGWINFSQGALNKGNVTAVKSGDSTRIDYSKIARFSLDGDKIELVTSGLQNIWGFQLRASGQWYLTEANDMGLSVTPAEPSTGFKGIGGQKLRTYQPWFPPLHKFRVGASGISGLAFSDDSSGGFPREWQDVAFLANPITSAINCVKITRNEDGSVSATHLPDFLKSKDDWFRPVNIEFGPDGCLYIADWYNKIISHNELPTTHPDRDKSHGRIWRIRHVSQTARDIPNLLEVPTAELTKHLKSPYLWEKRSAWHQIADRPANETRDLAGQLTKITADTSEEKATRIHALWSLESIGHFDPYLIMAMVNDEDADIRREAIRSLAAFKISPEDLARFLKNITKEKNVMVRSQALRTIEALGKANHDTIDIAVSFCHPASASNHPGNGYEQNFERYLARRALECYPNELKAYLETPRAAKQPAVKRIWAQQALGKQSTDSFARQWRTLQQKPLDRDTLIIVSGASDSAENRKTIAPYFRNPENTEHIAKLALENIADAYSPAFGYPMAETAMSLVNSGEKDKVILGLKLARGYRITHLSPDFAKLLPTTTDESIIRAILTTLSHQPQAFAESFLAIINEPANSQSLRTQALAALVQAQQNNAAPEVIKALTETPDQKASIIAALGNSTQGCQLLIRLVETKHIEASDISLPVAQRIFHVAANNPTAIAISQQAESKKTASVNSAMARIPALEEVAESNSGNAIIGQSLFAGMCLSCHVVGDQGAGVGPALDGSSERDTEHLLTAILNPDAAAESAYVLFRTIESSGLITEGLKARQDERGTTVAHQGGMITYIPKRTIRSQQHVGSTSFMPSGLIDSMPDETIAHLLAYIKTLK